MYMKLNLWSMKLVQIIYKHSFRSKHAASPLHRPAAYR